ncbi:MAG: hypothetical protein JSS14_27420 [Proteobacteria bacterium]|nr:hypothetical protein [Pseudomonadota bacterium]
MTFIALRVPALRHVPVWLALSCALPLAWSADDSARLASMSESELDAGMKRGVQVVMQRVPIQMEDQSVLVGAEYEPASRVATYHYMQAGRLDPQSLRVRLTAKNCSTPNTRAMLDRGIIFRHLYTVGDRQLDVTVRDSDCTSRG